MIKLEEVFCFDHPKITAASGLILHEGHFYCVSDDETSLMWFSSQFDSPVSSLTLFQGPLPIDDKDRKKLKPDLESIVYVPTLESILCLPSGSTENRHRGALINSAQQVQELSLKQTYSLLKTHFLELNIEGAVIVDKRIRLFQRGNGKLNQNAIIDLNLNSFLLDQAQDFSLVPVDLGFINQTPLSFTDACYFHEAYYFLAVAEKTSSTYEDGAFAGAILGMMNEHGEVLRQYKLDIPFKPEGLVVDNHYIYLVTDADDKHVPSRLFRGHRPDISTP